MDDKLVIAGKELRSRLFLGTGKYRNYEEMNAAFEASGAEVITVALRRLDLSDPNKKTLLDEIDWSKYTILPNTAGCRTADEAVRTAHLARAMGLSNWVKLEVIPDPVYLLPDPIGTFEAAKRLVDEGFVVLPYINDDPVLAKRLEEVGCATVMPLASPIGSGQGMVNFEQIKIIIDQAKVPVVVDAGLGALGCLFGNGDRRSLPHQYCCSLAQNPAQMAKAMRLGIEAGRTLTWPVGSLESLCVGQQPNERRCSVGWIEIWHTK